MSGNDRLNDLLCVRVNVWERGGWVINCVGIKVFYNGYGGYWDECIIHIVVCVSGLWECRNVYVKGDEVIMTL